VSQNGAGPGRLCAICAIATVWEGSYFQKTQKCSQNFQVLRLQATITPQWLQIAGNSLPNGPSAECLVSIFTVRINSKPFPGLYVPYKKCIYPNIRQRPILRIKTNSTPQCWCGLAKGFELILTVKMETRHSVEGSFGSDILKKADWPVNWKYVTRQITLASLSCRHVTLGIVECRN